MSCIIIGAFHGHKRDIYKVRTVRSIHPSLLHSKTDYTDLLSLQYILAANLPTAKSAWEDYMQRCDRLLEKADPNTRWDLATKQLSKSNGKLLGDKNPEWNDELPRWLWDQGVGLCTAFAIAANQSSKIDATYNEYNGKHRNATKIDIANNSAIILDPGRGEAFHVIILHRTPVKDSHGTFGAVTMFSGLHRAWRLQEPSIPGYVFIRYIVFGGGSREQKETCHDAVSRHLKTLQAAGDVRDRVLSQVLETFAQAT
jgi:hypothetical protein